MNTNQQISCRGAYSNIVSIFKNTIENMRSDMRNAEKGEMITIDNISTILSQLQDMINNTLYNLGYEVKISMSTLNESVNRNNKVRLSESQLHDVIRRCINEALEEMDPRTYASVAKKRQKQADDALKQRREMYNNGDRNYSQIDYTQYQRKADTARQAAIDAWNREFGVNNDKEFRIMGVTGFGSMNVDYKDRTNGEKSYFNARRGKFERGHDMNPGYSVAHQMSKGTGTYINGKGYQ